MFANFTEETCTGTGSTMALAGATTGSIQFSKSFSDGDAVAYVIEDSGGTIIVAGTGTYVSATDDITRNDKWHWNGTAIDSSPATNPTLSAGTHTIRCDVAEHVGPLSIPKMGKVRRLCAEYQTSAAGATYGSFAVNTIYYMPFMIFAHSTFSEIGMMVNANPTGNVRLGIYSVGPDGYPERLLVESSSIVTTTTGEKSDATIALDLSPGMYFAAMVADGAFDPGASQISSLGLLGGDTSTDSSVICIYRSHTFGALPNPAVTTSFTSITTRGPLVWLE